MRKIEVEISEITIIQVMHELDEINKFQLVTGSSEKQYNVTKDEAIEFIKSMADLYIRWESRHSVNQMIEALESSILR